MRFGLERMERALDALGRPERDLAVLHVAGTNGKGSTCAMAAEALRLAGHRVGLYTSPHLVDFRERIQVDGRPIPEDVLAARIAEVRRACPWHERDDDDRLTYFEFATLLGLLHLARERVDAAVVEVGLGGRFDATNAVTPRVTAVSRIGLDQSAVPGRPRRRHRAREGRHLQAGRPGRGRPRPAAPGARRAAGRGRPSAAPRSTWPRRVAGSRRAARGAPRGTRRWPPRRSGSSMRPASECPIPRSRRESRRRAGRGGWRRWACLLTAPATRAAPRPLPPAPHPHPGRPVEPVSGVADEDY